MSKVTDYPLLCFVIAFVALWLSAQIGAFGLRKRRGLEEDLREDFGIILAATLTLLGLIIGFSFSMAVSRYDQRKNLEEAEANAIGTEYVRADLLPAADAAKVRALLRSYLDQRVLFYTTRDVFYTSSVDQQLRQINDRTAQLQAELWAAVQAPAAAQPTPIIALAVWGMNDVLNSQGYTQAAWLNRIPLAAWGLMVLIAVCCNVLIGYGTRNPRTERILLLILPLVVGIALFLIADIDSPRGGVIRVIPQNLLSLAGSLRAQ
jgi:drug/metabolite transporter (DMT)-like permease